MAKAVAADYMVDSVKASNDRCKTLAKDLRAADCNGDSPADNCTVLRDSVDSCKTFTADKKQKEQLIKQVLDG